MTKSEIIKICKGYLHRYCINLDFVGEYACLEDIKLIHYEKYDDIAYAIFKINDDRLLETTLVLEDYFFKVKSFKFDSSFSKYLS